MLVFQFRSRDSSVSLLPYDKKIINHFHAPVKVKLALHSSTVFYYENHPSVSITRTYTLVSYIISIRIYFPRADPGFSLKNRATNCLITSHLVKD